MKRAPEENVIFVPSRYFTTRDEITGLRILRPEIEKWCGHNLRKRWYFESRLHHVDRTGRKIFKPAIRFKDVLDCVVFKNTWAEKLDA